MAPDERLSADTGAEGNLTLRQFVAEIAALATPAEHVAIVGEAWETQDLAKMMDTIITEARRQLEAAQDDGLAAYTADGGNALPEDDPGD